MRKKSLKSILVILAFSTIFIHCSEERQDQLNDNFNRKAMLQNWADNIIVPGYQVYVAALKVLKSTTETFTASPSVDNLNQLRSAWFDANLAWQAVGMFEIGKAATLTLTNFTNVYPTNTADLIETIKSGNYDLTSVGKQDEQGFPAIEFLIYGVRTTDQEIVDLFLLQPTGNLYKQYLIDLATRLETMAQTVLMHWENGYRQTFIDNSGSASTSSVNQLINDYIFYYERNLRAGKIGIPAGVFSGKTAKEKVEAPYSGKSKELFMAGINAMQDFFNGKFRHSDSPTAGEGLNTYLDFINTVSEGEDLGNLINAQFVATKKQAAKLGANFGTQVADDNRSMLQTYDELQKNVINLKVDMLQALNIRVDFVDADGD